MRRRPKQLRKRIARACRSCKGHGQFLIGDKVVQCRKCKGTGRVRNK
jgi:DnaJ-class molecular chaperone